MRWGLVQGVEQTSRGSQGHARSAWLKREIVKGSSG